MTITVPRPSLGELALSFVDGPFGSDLQASEYVEVGVPIARIQNVRPNQFNDANQRFITDQKARGLARHDYSAGDVLITKLGEPCGIACLVPAGSPPGRIVADVTRFRGRAEVVDHQYLAHYLNSSVGQQEVLRRAKGTTRQRINLSSLKEIPIPLPALAEQRRIAAILDKADALLRTRRNATLQLDTLNDGLVNAAYQEMAPTALLGQLCDVQGGLQLSWSRAQLPIEVPYLRVANVYRNRLDLSEIKKIRATQSELGRTALLNGDILFVEGHGNPKEIGRCAVWDGSITPCVHQNHLIRARPVAEELDTLTLSFWLNSPIGRRYLLKRGKTTSGLNTITVSDVKATPVPLLRRNKREGLRFSLEKVGQLRIASDAQSATLEALFSALQYRAFSGRL